ncbi:MAG: hypothetical protein L3J41_08350 [Melioribacteraceae bacterium]|nr:hypothetical protein [Melioribacteraceae bacterium]
MERVVNIIKPGEETDKNILFWKSRTPEERLSAVQALREQHITFFNKQDEYNESREGLRRIYRVIKRTES